MELNESDGPDAVYVCYRDNEGRVNSGVTLLPATGPYFMQKIFPQIWCEIAELLNSKTV